MLTYLRPELRPLLLTGLLLLVTLQSATASTDEDSVQVATPAPKPWQVNMVTRLAASQTGSQNWAEGGANTLATTLGLDGKITFRSESWAQNHEIKLAIGLVKQDTLDFRKATDEIRIRSSFEYKGDGFFEKVNPTVATDISTQFTAGYNYKKNPFPDQVQLPARVSNFFAPATFVQTVGFTYNPKETFMHRMGVGAKQTVVMEEPIRQLYNMAINEPVRFEVGLESRTKLDREVFENVHLKSSLGLFAAFNKPDLPDLLWENEIAMRVNKWIGVRVEFKALYDRDVTSQVQLKEALSLGVSYNVL